MLILAYACYILWWFFLKMKDPVVEMPQIRGEVKRLGRFAKVIGIAFVAALLLSTGCDSLVAGFEHSDEVGFVAAAKVWQDLLSGVLWLTILI